MKKKLLRIMYILVFLICTVVLALWGNLVNVSHNKYKIVFDETNNINVIADSVYNLYELEPAYFTISVDYKGTPQKENPAIRNLVETYGDEPLISVGVRSALGEETVDVILNDYVKRLTFVATQNFNSYGYISANWNNYKFHVPVGKGRVEYFIIKNPQVTNEFVKYQSLEVKILTHVWPQNNTLKYILFFLSQINLLVRNLISLLIVVMGIMLYLIFSPLVKSKKNAT